jgi:hypothetical protein
VLSRHTEERGRGEGGAGEEGGRIRQTNRHHRNDMVDIVDRSIHRSYIHGVLKSAGT